MLQITEDLDMQHDTGVESTSRWIERFKVASEHVLQSGKKIQTSKKKSETTRYTNVHVQFVPKIFDATKHPGGEVCVRTVMHEGRFSKDAILRKLVAGAYSYGFDTD